MNRTFDHSICSLMGFALLSVRSDGAFDAHGQLPPWWSMIDQSSLDGSEPFHVDERFPFLENFLIDAHELWDGDNADRMGSGIWQFQSENGTDLMLEAFAVHTGLQKLLIIQNVTQSGTAFELLQKGRGRKLELLRDLARRRQLELELQTGQEQATQLARAKTEFVGHVSHEMRTPLTTILGMCELLSESELQAQQRSHLQALEDSARSLLNVVSDLLDVARIDAGKITTIDVDFSPQVLVRRVERDYRPAALERGITLETRLAENLPEEIHSDKNRILQILNNLVDNAIKFTDHGAVTISAELVQKKSDPVVEFEVSDTGVGIDLQEQPIIFDSYMQSEQTSSQNEHGVGLGLAIASRLTEAIDGEISVKSTPGEGSVFTLSIPIDRKQSGTSEEPVDSPIANAVAPADDENRGSSDKGPPGPFRILVAEDNPVNRKFIKLALSKAGHDVTTATNGQEVVDATADNDFDVVLMDCQMPVLSGYDATLAIRERESTTGKHLPIIAVTAHAMKENRQRCLKAGMDSFVTKPFRTKDLLEIVRQFAGRKSGN